MPLDEGAGRSGPPAPSPPAGASLASSARSVLRDDSAARDSRAGNGVGRPAASPWVRPGPAGRPPGEGRSAERDPAVWLGRRAVLRCRCCRSRLSCCAPCPVDCWPARPSESPCRATARASGVSAVLPVRFDEEASTTEAAGGAVRAEAAAAACWSGEDDAAGAPGAAAAGRPRVRPSRRATPAVSAARADGPSARVEGRVRDGPRREPAPRGMSRAARAGSVDDARSGVSLRAAPAAAWARPDAASPLLFAGREVEASEAWRAVADALADRCCTAAPVAGPDPAARFVAVLVGGAALAAGVGAPSLVAAALGEAPFAAAAPGGAGGVVVLAVPGTAVDG